MKILFLTRSHHTMNFFRPMAKMLHELGHKVRVISLVDVPVNLNDPWETYQDNWGAFDWKNIYNFDPDRVVVFNGKFKDIHAATSYLRIMYTTLFAEVAWLPQRDFIYLDQDIHNKSNISKYLIHERESLKKLPILSKGRQILQDLKNRYRYSGKDLSLPADFILVPMQLDYDTSILYASPEFKSMTELVGFVRHTAPNAPIVVKAHPKSHENVYLKEQFKKIGIAHFIDDKSVPMNDLVIKSKMIVGINSTGLMEALIHNKPILQLGNNIVHSENQGCMLDFAYYSQKKLPVQECYNDVMAGKAEGYDADLMYKSVLHLWANQIDFRSPPEWAVQKIINGDTSPRSIMDL